MNDIANENENSGKIHFELSSNLSLKKVISFENWNAWWWTSEIVLPFKKDFYTPLKIIRLYSIGLRNATMSGMKKISHMYTRFHAVLPVFS